jgi:hypothetical protein
VILLWGLPGDRPLREVATRLIELGAPAYLLDQRVVGATTVTATLGPPIAGRILVDGVEVVALEAVTAAYIRPYDSRRMPAVAAAGDGSTLWAHALELDMTLLAWADLAPGLIVNRPEAMISNDSKPFQAQAIMDAGFHTPETLITTDIRALEQFRDDHGSLIYKSIGATRSVVKRLGHDNDDRLQNLRWCPTQFQQYIHGVDFRVHVIAGEVFAAEVISDADDYRYAASFHRRLEVRAADLPSEVAARCRQLTEALGLAFAGIDLRVSTDDRWYCFEVNPSPGYSFYQQHTGASIDLAVAKYLARAP